MDCWAQLHSLQTWRRRRKEEEKWKLSCLDPHPGSSTFCPIIWFRKAFEILDGSELQAELWTVATPIWVPAVDPSDHPTASLLPHFFKVSPSSAQRMRWQRVVSVSEAAGPASESPELLSSMTSCAHTVFEKGRQSYNFRSYGSYGLLWYLSVVFWGEPSLEPEKPGIGLKWHLKLPLWVSTQDLYTLMLACIHQFVLKNSRSHGWYALLSKCHRKKL